MRTSILLAMLFLNSCGAFKVTDNPPYRKIASIDEAQESLLRTVEEKIEQIHYYNVIGQQQLLLFDEQLEELNINKIYNSQIYLKLQAVRSQTEEIEHELIAIIEQLDSSKTNVSAQQKKLAIMLRLAEFSKSSRVHAFSMENLISHLDLDSNDLFTGISKIKGTKSLSANEVNQEIENLKSISQFQVFEKNIDHLSYMLESKTEGHSKTFEPSATKSGNITGNEFPAKVWSLTFDDGPKKETSPIILEELKKRGLVATFFQLTNQVKANPLIASMIREAGMELASHSYTHQQLTKVGAQGLTHEISTAVKDLEKIHGTKIKFYRLPYGAGVSTPTIRTKIAESGLIHVFWNIDTLDWMAQAPEKIVERTINLMKKTQRDAGVILFHDIHYRTTTAAPKIMDYLKKENRRVCTLNDIVTQMNKGETNVCPQK